MKPILKWQYDQMVKELLLLQEHQTDTSCPCATGGEMCVRKHLMTLEAYAQETLPMEDNEHARAMLQEFSAEAQRCRTKEEAALRGEGEHVSLLGWTRGWRKNLEQYSLAPPD